MVDILIRQSPGFEVVSEANWASRPSATPDGTWLLLEDTDAVYRYSSTIGDGEMLVLAQDGFRVNVDTDSVVIDAADIQGTDDGTGIVMGHVGASSNKGSALQLASFTTTERGYLSATNGMMIYNETTSKIQAYAGGTWVDLH